MGNSDIFKVSYARSESIETKNIFSVLDTVTVEVEVHEENVKDNENQENTNNSQKDINTQRKRRYDKLSPNKKI